MDIGSSSQPPATKEEQLETLFECSNCKAKNKLKNLLSERSSPIEDGLIEGVIICPDCGKETHSYWLSKKLMAARHATNNIIKALSAHRTQKNLDMMIEIRQKYKDLFDEEQEKYRAIIEGT